MKTGITITVDIEFLETVKTYCATKNLNISEFINRLIADWYKEKKGETATIILCGVCGASYSNAIEICPNCAMEKARKKETEILTIEQGKEYKEQQKKRNAIIEMQILELQNEGRKIQQGELPIDEKTAQTNILQAQITELRKQYQ